MVISACYYLDITILKKYKKKIDVVVMDPVMLHRESMVHILRESLADRVNITDTVSSISEIIRLIVLKGPANIYIMEAYGSKENYKTWSDFTHFMATNYPTVTCLVWTSKPTMFLRKLNAYKMKEPCWQIPKRIDIDSFLRFFERVLDGEIPSHSTRTCIGPPMSNLTLSEIVMITEIIEGGSIKSLAKKYNVAYKTVSSHKRNAMTKMRISSTAQLRSLFMEGYILRGDKARCLLIEINDNQPFLL
ncbi:LuxR C-terminal-related transcriptional regulator [Serratia nevei]|uniref:helix-turn-helix transcriptional regulator n=1 Tax=Serratia nevei TaxID=2703794 RepID=UPI00313C2D7E